MVTCISVIYVVTYMHISNIRGYVHACQYTWLRACLYDTGALEKKKLYKKAVEDRRGTFTPFVTSVDGLLHREAEHFLKHIATSIAAKWEKSYAETCAFELDFYLPWFEHQAYV